MAVVKGTFSPTTVQRPSFRPPTPVALLPQLLSKGRSSGREDTGGHRLHALPKIHPKVSSLVIAVSAEIGTGRALSVILAYCQRVGFGVLVGRGGAEPAPPTAPAPKLRLPDG